MLVAVISGWVIFRLDAKASHVMNISMITATIEINEPIEDMVFHMV